MAAGSERLGGWWRPDQHLPALRRPDPQALARFTGTGAETAGSAPPSSGFLGFVRFIFMFFGVFIFTCGRHNHPHMKVKFLCAGALPVSKIGFSHTI